MFSPSGASVSLYLLLSIVPALATNPFTQYAVEFPDPSYVARADFPKNVGGAQDTIVQWAKEMASYGPWSVTKKPVVAPSGDKHDYMSWAPYQWADCSSVKNTTALSLADMQKTCPYVFRDGQVNPDRFIINDFQSFFNLSDAILYNAIASTFQNESSSVYSQNVVKFVKSWFLDADTAMNPNLNFGQMQLGPTGQTGTYTGVLDLRGFAKIASGILILRERKNSDWTTDIDNQMMEWVKKYIEWLETSPSGKQAASSDNNHGTIFVSQMAALKLVVNDKAAAAKLTDAYFKGTFQGQVQANGDQPKEAGRTHPFHYRNFNIAGMIANARISKYADPESKPWNATANGATIKTTIDFLMTTDPAAKGEQNVFNEILPNVAAVASVYGDADGTYGKFLAASNFPFADDATFLWDQPLAGGHAATESDPSSPGGPAGKGGAASMRVGWVAAAGLVSSVLFGLNV
ncbi:chondroitin AC/alginate lyase [Mycena rebaudengoi]|nr:chondroitin AC/alginate lyase [Mycena rebaudengoi]